MTLFSRKTFILDTENAFKIGNHIRHLESAGYPIVKLNLGEPDFNIPEPIKTEIKRQLDNNNTHYCDPKGLFSLRKAISNEIERTRDIIVSPDQVVVFPGAKPGIGFSQQVYCNPGDEIIYPSPGYPIYESFIKYFDCVPVPLHLTEEMDFTISSTQLEQLLSPKTKLIFLNFPANPTGGVASRDQIEEIAHLILKKCDDHVRVFSDEIYEKIIFDNQSHYSISSVPGMEKRTIISSGFSKAYAWTGGRIGYVVLPTIEEAEVFTNLNINYFSCVSPYNQEAARIAIEDPLCAEAVSKMLNVLDTRRITLVEALNAIPNVHCHLPKGAFFVFLNIEKVCERLNIFEAYRLLNENIRCQTSPSTLFQMFALYQHHVAILDRRSFGKIDSENQHYVRLSYTSDLAVIQEGVSRLKAAFEDREGFQSFYKAGKNLF